MTSRFYFPLLAAIAATWLAGCGPRAGMEQFLPNLYDWTRLARLDTPAARIVTSFDRTGGNDDFNNPVRRDPDGWAVLADLPGPGCVTRCWFTGTNGKHPLQFYFDNEKKPRIDTTMDGLVGGQPPYLRPVAAYEPWCWYSLVPLPYRTRLIIKTPDGKPRPDGTSDKPFYQIGYCPLPAKPRVQSYPAQLDKLQTAMMTETRAQLMEALDGQRALAPPPWPLQSASLTLAPGQTLALADLAGPAILRDLRVTPDWTGWNSVAARNAALRNVILRIHWNGQAAASVAVPLGDFFGSFWGQRRFCAAYFGCVSNTLFARFPMPFERTARITLENQGAQPLTLAVATACEPLAVWSNAWGYFHAGWLKSGPQHIGQPHPVLRAVGRGRYVGCILSAVSLDQSWWLLEGDEAMRVDGESFPQWHGTGLEDYFNGGWYYGNPLVMPFHGLLFKAQFRAIQYRIHQTDPVAFENSFHMQFERGPNHASRGWFESVAFYYLAAPAAADSALDTPAWRAPPPDPQLAPATIMPEINNLERLGDFQGAADFVRLVNETMPQYPFLPSLQLRLLAYAERDQGWAAVKPQVEAFLAATTNDVARRQAEDWLWFEASPSNALLGVYCNMRAQVFLDGRHIAQCGDPERMQFFRVTLTPGPHALAVQSVFQPMVPWVQVALRSHQGDFRSNNQWKSAYTPAGRWADVEFNDSGWDLVGGLEDQSKGPPEEPYIFLEPHPFVDLQAHARTLRPAGDWTDPNVTAVMRYTFETR